jgi:hypothetical protein
LERDCIRDLAKKSGTLAGSGTFEHTVAEREPFLLSLRRQAQCRHMEQNQDRSAPRACRCRLELARLLLADFDPDVTAIAAQPFLLRARISGRVRRHVPDFLLVHADQTVQVVNVKPAARMADPAVAQALAWPGELFEVRGWGHEVWTGADPVLLANVRFLAGYRRPGMPPDTVTAAVLGEIRPGERIGRLLDRLEDGWPRPAAKAAVLRLLWQRRVSTDLSRPLDAGNRAERRMALRLSEHRAGTLRRYSG